MYEDHDRKWIYTREREGAAMKTGLDRTKYVSTSRATVVSNGGGPTEAADAASRRRPPDRESVSTPSPLVRARVHQRAGESVPPPSVRRAACIGDSATVNPHDDDGGSPTTRTKGHAAAAVSEGREL